MLNQKAPSLPDEPFLFFRAMTVLDSFETLLLIAPVLLLLSLLLREIGRERSRAERE
jgi:hypothetical protein